MRPRIPKTMENRLILIQNLADGMTRTQIAKTLNMDRGNVSVWLNETYQLLGADNAQHAVAICFRRKLIQ